MKGPYDDIINLPHHVSAARPRMPVQDRAAQFMPFRALTGYEDAVQEMARLTDEKLDLSEDEKARLDIKLQPLLDGSMTGQEITLTWFQPDKRKAGGAYVTTTGQVKKIDDFEGALILLSGESIPVEDILDIQPAP